jgi:hypothetical protein
LPDDSRKGAEEEGKPLLDDEKEPEPDQPLTIEEERILNRAWYIVDDDWRWKHWFDIFMGPLISLSVFSTFYM